MATIFRPDVLREWRDQKLFIDDIAAHYFRAFGSTFLGIDVSAERLAEAHEFWIRDLDRLKQVELNGSDPDHFKTCGHLSYWLRRTSPIVSIQKRTAAMAAITVGNDGVEQLTADQSFFMRYANEYAALEIGFRMCVLYETRGVGVRPDQAELHMPRFVLREEFVHNFCHMLKEKNVSPHALYIAYCALFRGLVQV